jgi:hypothetical protein
MLTLTLIESIVINPSVIQKAREIIVGYSKNIMFINYLFVIIEIFQQDIFHVKLLANYRRSNEPK